MASKPKKAEREKAEDEDADGESAQPKRKFPLPSRKVMIIAAAGFVVLAGGGAGAYFMFAGGKDGASAAIPSKPPAFVDVPEVLVNLSTVGADRTQYLKVKIVL